MDAPAEETAHGVRQVPAPCSVIRVRGSRYGRAAMERDLAKLTHTATGRHTTLFHIAANAGSLAAGGEIEIESALAALEITARLVGMPEAELRRTISDGVSRGVESPRRAPTDSTMIASANDARVEVVEWWERVCADDWSDRRGATTLKILGGFYQLATTAGKVRLRQSYREIAEAAGVSVGTVAKHEARWSRYVAVVHKGSRTGKAPRDGRAANPTNRSVFQLLTTARKGIRPEATVTAEAGLFPDRALSIPSAVALADPACDVWQHWAAGWRLWCALDDCETATAKQLAETTGRSVVSIRRTLNRLAEWQLASRDGDGGWRRLDVAPPTTVVPHRDRRRERHRAEREQFHAYLHARGLTTPGQEPAADISHDDAEAVPSTPAQTSRPVCSDACTVAVAALSCGGGRCRG
jgi:hypothetical protein